MGKRALAALAAVLATLGLSAVLIIAEEAPASEPATAASHDTDWPQWRGPDRNGVARQSPALLDEFPKEGPKKVWESEDAILCGQGAGGNGSIAVFDGRIYVKEHIVKPANYRLITTSDLTRLGYCPEMPADLSKKVEEARMSEERKRAGSVWAVSCKEWMDLWIKNNTTAEQSKYETVIRYRLMWGSKAVPLDALAKLVPIIDKKFEKPADWVKWVEESGLDADSQASLRALDRTEEVQEYLYCLSAATGKTLWKSPMSTAADPFTHNYKSSNTPAVSDGKVYVNSVANTVFCFDAGSGKRLWESAPLGTENNHGRYSSMLIHQNVAVIVTARGVSAVSAADGKTMWSVPGTGLYAAGSAVAWSKGDKWYILAEFEKHLKMIDPQTGAVIASALGGGNSTPAIVGDYAAASTPGALRAYKLSPTSLQCIWTVPFNDDFTAPLIDGKYLYVLGGSDFYGKETKPGKAMCLELETGRVMWEEPMSLANYGSLALADGKLIGVVGKELVMFRASPEKFQLVGRTDLSLERWISPAIADGKVYLRTAKKIVCYDLAKPRKENGK